MHTKYEQETDTRFHIITNSEKNLVKTLIDTDATHSYAVSGVIENINLIDYKSFQLLLNNLIIANGQEVEIIG